MAAFKKKFYCLDMFPYPSGAGLHVGHVEGYTASDILSRMMRLKGYDVIHPMGWDAFGLPAENYAIKTGIHPNITTDKAIATFKQQMNDIGLSYDWEREIQTSKPEYYKWTQWFFLLFYKNGLAYKKKAKVNWCNHCMTVLANEQAEGGVCERCGNQVIQKDLEQWFFKITDFIEDQKYEGRSIKGLLSGLEDLDWPASTKAAQINWIGRSEGAMVTFKVKDKKSTVAELEVFTTRPDTLFGCTYMAVNPEHSLLQKFAERIENLAEIKTYAASAQAKTELERTDLNKEKTGLEILGLVAINPVNGREIKIFVADYVLSTYGTGAVMAVPAHDERDYEFCKKHKLEMIEVVSGGDISKEAYTENGIMINSHFLNGLPSGDAKSEMIKWLEKENCGRKTINYRLRDWLISRQRYWGAPIPIIYCDKCGTVPVPELELPVLLPTDVDFKPTGESPLVYSRTFHDVKCPQCGAAARRESDTMDTFVCSSWYFFRFLDPHNDREFAARQAIEAGMPVDTYIGGAEHTVLHLLYARFFTKVLQKFGYIDFNEPFLKLRHQGIILAEDGNKMSKSKGNVINPDDVVRQYGADSLRLYEMFMGVFNESKPWNTKSIIGVRRFLDKILNLAEKVDARLKPGQNQRKLLIELHRTIKKVGEDIQDFKFNTAVSQLMIVVNEFTTHDKIPQAYFETLLIVLFPFAPFTAQELWAKLGHKSPVHQQSWPAFDQSLLLQEEVSISVQVNGKLRGVIAIPRDAAEETILKIAQADSNIGKYLADGYKKHIYIPNKILNFVV